MEQRLSLLPRIKAAEDRALRSGALRPIATRSRILEQDGLRYLIRILERFQEKARAHLEQREGRGQSDPFLPYEEALFVTELGLRHVLLLNKFPVLAHHALIVTRAFEQQESPLTVEDLRALSICMRQDGGLGFYNSGPAAGASQPHKHLQWVPTPLEPAEEHRVPIEPWLSQEALRRGRIQKFPFQHALRGLAPGLWEDAQAGEKLLAAYRDLLLELGMEVRDDGRLPPYNLLVAPDWMLLVPRRREHWEGVSTNALAFAGAFLVRNESQYRRLRAVGPLQALASVAQ